MKEEQAVLDFFAQPENLPLALSVAEQTDQIREQLNTRFWYELMERVGKHMIAHDLAWRIATTEDKNAEGSLVGFNCLLNTDQPLYIRPMMEQQNLGKGLQIYFGLMWSGTPTPDHLSLPAVSELRESLNAAGFKSNESFLAWQWLPIHPRSRAFLLRFNSSPELVFAEIVAILDKVLLNHRLQIDQANLALRAAPRSMKISLDQLRTKRA